MSLTPDRTGAKASAATDFTPEVVTWKLPRASRVMMVTATRTSSSRVVRGRRDRRGIATGELPADRSAGRRGDEDLLEGVELLEALPAADGDAVQWIAGHHDRHPGLLPVSYTHLRAHE